ncbi:hypothetical protein V6N11_072202 [Hibiscus sabdariffa]|uniref:Caffeoyl-CoA O-methyltransferase n=1 Tax=Hibiscus sabdariffa TaxID=183260 RepID=A0ABR2U2B6_9ROSI
MGLLQSFELSKYILENNVYPREPSALKEIRDATANHPAYFMSTAPDAAQLMGMLLKLLHAKKTIEIGVYTSYSLLLTALSTPHDAMQKENEGSFDFAFVDADKDNYLNYHERLLKLVKVGGLIVFDNTLCGGTVAQPEEAIPRLRKETWRSIIEFNKSFSTDQRVEISLAPLGDGITICRRIC